MLTHLRVKPGDVESIPDLNRGAMGNGERLGFNGHGNACAEGTEKDREAKEDR